MNLIESDRRREGFSAGQAVTLADGQSWTFPRPLVECRPSFAGGRASLRDATNRLTFGPAHAAALAAIWSAEDELEKFERTAYLAADLLSANYQLSDDELSDLLSWTIYEDDGTRLTDASAAMWRAISGAIVLPEQLASRDANCLCPACGQPKPPEAR